MTRTLEDVIGMTRKRRGRLSDETILNLADGIRNADAWELARSADVSSSVRAHKVLNELQARLDGIETTRPEPEVPMSDSSQKRNGFGIGELGQVSEPASTPADEAAAATMLGLQTGQCEHCGVVVPTTWLLTTSLGQTVCHDCYDRLESQY